MAENEIEDLGFIAKWEKVKSIVNGRDITIDIGHCKSIVSVAGNVVGTFNWPRDAIDFIINNEEFLKLKALQAELAKVNENIKIMVDKLESECFDKMNPFTVEVSKTFSDEDIGTLYYISWGGAYASLKLFDSAEEAQRLCDKMNKEVAEDIKKEEN
jgi:hypothetical protein